MKIFRIFEELKGIELYVVQYEGEIENEYDRLFYNWTNPGYLYEYAKSNHIADVTTFSNEVLMDAEKMEDIFFQYVNPGDELATFFRPLSDVDIGVGTELSPRKGKLRRNRLRIYAIQLEERSFLITGGAIKMSHRMQDHPDTLRELEKIKKVKQYLTAHGVFDSDSLNDYNQEGYDK
jgi:hypothetical protein